MANWLFLSLLLLFVGISRSQTATGLEDVKPEPQPPTLPETGPGGDSLFETSPSPQLPSENAQSQSDEDAAFTNPQSEDEIDTQDEANSNTGPSDDVNGAEKETDEENYGVPTDDENPMAGGTLQPATLKSFNQESGLPSDQQITLPLNTHVSNTQDEARAGFIALAKKIPFNLASEQMDQWRQNISDSFGLSPLETAKPMLPLGFSADKGDSPMVQTQNSPSLKQNDPALQSQNTGMEDMQKSLLPFSQNSDSGPAHSQTDQGFQPDSQSLLPLSSIFEDNEKSQLPSDLDNDENSPGDQGKDVPEKDTLENTAIGNPPSASDKEPESPGDDTPTYYISETDEDYEDGDDKYDSVFEKGKDSMDLDEDKGDKDEDYEEDYYKDTDVTNATEGDARFKGNDKEYGVNGNEAIEEGEGKTDKEKDGTQEVVSIYKPSINKNSNENDGDDDGTQPEADDDIADDQDDDYENDYEGHKNDKSDGEVMNQVEDNKQNINVGKNDNTQNNGELEMADKPPQDTLPEPFRKKESEDDDYKFDNEELPWMNKPSHDNAKDDDWYYNPGEGETALKTMTAGNTLATALFPELPYGQKVNKTKGSSTQISAPSEFTEGVISVEEARSRKPLQAPKGTIILYTALIVCLIAGIVIFSIWKNPFKIARTGASHATPVIRTGEEGKRLLDHPFV